MLHIKEQSQLAHNHDELGIFTYNMLLYILVSGIDVVKPAGGTSVRMTELCFGVIGWGSCGPKIARNLDAVPTET